VAVEQAQQEHQLQILNIFQLALQMQVLQVVQELLPQLLVLL
jgi:hypothetical protein